MKHTYIKPEMELLDSDFTGILCVSGMSGDVHFPDGGGGGNIKKDDDEETYGPE